MPELLEFRDEGADVLGRTTQDDLSVVAQLHLLQLIARIGSRLDNVPEAHPSVSWILTLTSR